MHLRCASGASNRLVRQPSDRTQLTRYKRTTARAEATEPGLGTCSSLGVLAGACGSRGERQLKLPGAASAPASSRQHAAGPRRGLAALEPLPPQDLHAGPSSQLCSCHPARRGWFATAVLRRRAQGELRLHVQAVDVLHHLLAVRTDGANELGAKNRLEKLHQVQNARRGSVAMAAFGNRNSRKRR